MARVEVGDKWSAVECIEVKQNAVPVMLPDGHGGEYCSETVTRIVYVLRCQCGNVFDAPAHDFKGRKAYQDCGCGIRGGKKRNEIDPVCVVSVSLPMSLLKEVESRAKSQGWALSRAIRVLLQSAVSKNDSEWR